MADRPRAGNGDGSREMLAVVGARLVLGEHGPGLTYREPFAGVVGVATDQKRSG